MEITTPPTEKPFDTPDGERRGMIRNLASQQEEGGTAAPRKRRRGGSNRRRRGPRTEGASSE